MLEAASTPKTSGKILPDNKAQQTRRQTFSKECILPQGDIVYSYKIEISDIAHFKVRRRNKCYVCLLKDLATSVVKGKACVGHSNSHKYYCC
jgi:hypothetical protein